MQSLSKNEWFMQTDPAWYLGTSWNLYLRPLLGNLEPFGTFIWNPYLESRNPLEPLRRTLTRNFGTFRNLTCTWNPLLEPWLGTLTWNLATSSTFTLEPGNPYLEPRNLRNLEPLVAWNLYLEPLLGTLEPPGPLTCNLYSEPSGTFTWNPYLERRNLAEPA